MLPVAVLASLGLRWAVVGSNDVLNLWDHVHVQFCAGIGGLGPLLFLLIAGLVAMARSSFSHAIICRVGGLGPYPHSFSSAWHPCVARQEGGAGQLGGRPVGGVSCVTPACGA